MKQDKNSQNKKIPFCKMSAYNSQLMFKLLPFFPNTLSDMTQLISVANHCHNFHYHNHHSHHHQHFAKFAFEVNFALNIIVELDKILN